MTTLYTVAFNSGSWSDGREGGRSFTTTEDYYGTIRKINPVFESKVRAKVWAKSNLKLFPLATEFQILEVVFKKEY